jgi:MoxR-like ATPase
MNSAGPLSAAGQAGLPQPCRAERDAGAPANGAPELQAIQAEVRQIQVEESLRTYLVELVRSTRESEKVYLGASPRGSLALFRASQALAALNGRTFVTPDDIKQMAVPTLSHRLIGPAEAASGAGDQVVLELLERHPVPV